MLSEGVKAGVEAGVELPFFPCQEFTESNLSCARMTQMQENIRDFRVGEV